MSRSGDEQNLLGVVTSTLKSWLTGARQAVMRPWNQYKIQPDPGGVYQVSLDTDTILTELGKISLHAWSQATDVPPVSRHAFVMGQLAQTENFLVRIPDETYNLIFAVITDAINGGADLQGVADAVDKVLTWTGSEYWPNRARVIAITETTRAYGAGTLAAGMEQSRVTGKLLQKQWKTEEDQRVRVTHRQVEDMTIPLTAVFPVGADLMLYPGDPMASVDEVAGCRCDLLIVDGGQ